MKKCFLKKVITISFALLMTAILSCEFVSDNSQKKLLGKSSYENYKINRNTNSNRNNKHPFGGFEIPEDYEEFLQKPIKVRDISYPADFNWVEQGKVTNSKPQLDCDSCWAFASTGALESKILIKYNQRLDLAEQQQVACNPDMNGCDPSPSGSVKFWERKGPVRESNFKYNPYNLTCPDLDQHELPFRVNNYHYVNTLNIKTIKESIMKDGPAFFAFFVYDGFDSFAEWWNRARSGSVYKYNGLIFPLNISGHAVLLVGWDDAKEAWLCKNSWGSKEDPGGPEDNGFFWISYYVKNGVQNYFMDDFEVTKVADSQNAAYQAEDYGTPDFSIFPGYTGRGYVRMGRKSGNSFVVNGIRHQAGRCRLRVRYAMKGKGNQSCTVTVNGRNKGNLVFNTTSSWSQWSSVSMDFDLNKRTNTVGLSKNSRGGGLNIDSLYLVKLDEVNNTIDHCKEKCKKKFPRGPQRKQCLKGCNSNTNSNSNNTIINRCKDKCKKFPRGQQRRQCLKKCS